MKKSIFWKIFSTYIGTVLIALFIFNLFSHVWTANIAIILIMVAVGYFMARSISRPIHQLDKVAKAIAGGQLDERAEIRTHDELSTLAESCNRMALEIQAKIEQLEKMDNIRRDFVANVSHELKTPLTSIKGFIETLENGAIDDRDNAMKFLGVMRKHSERLSSIINDLLSLAEIEGEKDIRVTNFDIKILLDEIAWGFSHRLSSKKQNLNVDYNGSNFDINADKDKIEQVLVNLMDNAVKYTPEDGEIRTSLFEEKNSVMISIEDTGVGIPEEHLDRIFERFYRVDKARSRELGGTGLGLAIVKHIILLHKGHIDINSEVDKGTKITVVLPR